jgi:hypothetical protein
MKKHPHEIFLKILIILNLLDLCITIFAVEGGYAEEVNPIMGYFLNASPLAFAMFKIFVMQHALLVEYNRWVKKEKLSKKWVWYFLISVYGATVLWNVITVSLHAAGVM